MMTIQTIEVPFIKRGNRSCLSAQQLTQDQNLEEFVIRFSNCFELELQSYYYVFYPDGDSPHPVTTLGN